MNVICPNCNAIQLAVGSKWAGDLCSRQREQPLGPEH